MGNRLGWSVTKFIVTQEEQGWRLDRVVGKFLPEVGRRGAKRLIAAGHVLLNNKPAASLTKTRAGDSVSWIPPKDEKTPSAKFLDANEDYAFFLNLEDYTPRKSRAAAPPWKPSSPP